MTNCLSWLVQVVRRADSRAGMHLVAWLRDFDAARGEALIVNGRELGLDLYSILPYYQRPPDRAGLLMGYAGMSVGEIEQAVSLFARCVREMLSR